MSVQPDAGFPSEVLVVDDEPAILQIFEALLPKVGLPAVCAPDGEGALALLGEKQFGALLVDKNLPGIDGLQVVRAAREKQPYCACLVMTAYSSTGSVISALQLGAKDYLEKPFQDLDVILHKVRAAVDSARLERQRDQLLARIRSFEDELQAKDKEMARKLSEVETFNRVLEERVRQETEDLRRKCSLLESSLKSNQGLDLTVAMHTEGLLEHVKSVSLEDGTPIAVARGVLARVTRQLESNLSMLRSAQRSAAKKS